MFLLPFSQNIFLSFGKPVNCFSASLRCVHFFLQRSCCTMTQLWVHYQMFSNANLLIQIVVKESAAFTAGNHAGRMGLSCSKDPNSSMAFRKGFLKTEKES